MTRYDRHFRWLIGVVAAGMFAMHGLSSAHTAGAAMPMTTPNVGHASMVETSPAHTTSAVESLMPVAANLVPAHTRMAAMSACVALPALTLLALVLVAAHRRRQEQPAAPRTFRRGRQRGRDPPCPPPRVRGVCLT